MVFRNNTGPADFIEFGVKSGVFEELPVSIRAKRSLAAFWPFFAAIPNPESLSKDEADFGIKVATAAVEVATSDVDNAVAALHNFAARTVAARETGQAVGVRFSSQQVPASDAPVEDKKEAVAEDDDDAEMFDIREAAKEAPAKKKEGPKISILLNVMPWDAQTDMHKLEETVRSVKMEGLTWGASKLVAVGNGIKKLQIMMTIVEGLVSVDHLIEEYLTCEPADEYIKSCDILLPSTKSKANPVV